MKHRELIELLPWYVNGTLHADERRAVETHLAACPACARDVEGLKAVQGSVVTLAEQAPEPSPALLARALGQIEAHELARARTQERRVWRVERLRSWLEEAVIGWWKPIPVVARVVIAAQFVLVVGLTGLVIASWPGGTSFTTLGRPSVRENARARIFVSFHPGASEEAMRETIRSVRGTIVSGPSPLALYTIEVPLSRERTAEIEKLLETLRQKRDVIRLAGREP